jgi:hypothetical protein
VAAALKAMVVVQVAVVLEACYPLQMRFCQ